MGLTVHIPDIKFCIQIHYGNLYFVSSDTSEMNIILIQTLKLIFLSERSIVLNF